MKTIKYLIILSVIATLALSACAPAAPPAEEPAAEEPAADEPAAEEPAAEESAAEEPAAEEPAAEEPAVDPVKACWVFSNPIGDQGWTYAQDQGRQYVVENVSNVETVFVEAVPAGADAERVIRQFAEDGCDIIFTTSFSFVDSVEKLSPEYPDVLFDSYEGFTTSDNHSIHRVQKEEAAWLAGMLAANMTESNILGFVGAFANSDVLRHVNTFTRGARSVNPEITVRAVWINNWYDPVKEKEAADSLISLGVDVLLHNQASAAVVQAAEASKVYAIGYTDQDKFAPEYYITSEAINWGAIYAPRVQAVVDGDWEPQEKWYNMQDGAVFITSFGPKVPEDVAELIKAKNAEITAGDFDIWAGPILDQEGNIRIPEGEAMSSEDKLTMDYLVEGVEGEIPE